MLTPSIKSSSAHRLSRPPPWICLPRLHVAHVCWRYTRACLSGSTRFPPQDLGPHTESDTSTVYRVHACMHTCMHAYIHTFIHTYIHITDFGPHTESEAYTFPPPLNRRNQTYKTPLPLTQRPPSQTSPSSLDTAPGYTRVDLNLATATGGTAHTPGQPAAHKPEAPRGNGNGQHAIFLREFGPKPGHFPRESGSRGAKVPQKMTRPFPEGSWQSSRHTRLPMPGTGTCRSA